MKIELLVLLISGFFIANTYYDGKYIERIKSFKKYYQMFGIGFAGLSAYLFLKKYPGETRSLLNSASGVIRYLPVDKEAGDFLSPMIDFTKSTFTSGINSGMTSSAPSHANKILQSGEKNNTKRSVSETKKKYVAAQQGWKCGICHKQLPAWFEVDHKIRLDNGGSNHIENLVALCRDCHGKKTALENL
jgi:hypothetical protein